MEDKPVILVVDDQPPKTKDPILDDIGVPEKEIENWQITVDMLAEIVGIPAALIMRVHEQEIEVFLASHSPGNVYHRGEKAPLDMGLYCETVMSTQRKLLVPNALKDPDWDHNPDIDLGMISYCGLPLTWPNGEIFGTLCILDQKENSYLQKTYELMERFRDSIQLSLARIYASSLARIQKEKSAAELIIANKELVFQNEEKEKRAAELVVANKELEREITKRKQAEEDIHRLYGDSQRRAEHLEALREIDHAVLNSLDIALTMPLILTHVQAQLHVDAADVLLFNPHSHALSFAAGRGFRTEALKKTRLRLGEGNAGRAALERQIVSIPDLRTASDAFSRAPLLKGEDFVTYCAAPLIAKGLVKGVLEIFHRAPFTPDDEWLAFFQSLAGQTALAIDSALLFTDLQRSNVDLSLAYDATIEGWAKALDLRDKETEGHSRRVTEMAEQIAQAMDFSEADLVHVRRGALLHDMGKLGVPDGILLKPGPLTDEEWGLMRRHPQLAFDLLSPIAYLKLALDIPYSHHEKLDGSGYPRGLQGDKIPLSARIFAVVDVWDALRSDRPYRAAMPPEKARAIIEEGTGSHFDPQVVKAFFQEIQTGGET